jgi:hydrogenase nickel incorporation protein HypB
MCTTCGCNAGTSVSIQKVTNDGHGEQHHPHHHHHGHPHSHGHAHDHDHHSHSHEHGHDHHHEPARTHTIQLELDILNHNNKLAERNRGYFEAKSILALNLVSSPGSGKTTLLEKTLVAIQPQQACAVIEGDQQTQNDARRIAATGAPVVQINTGKGCHLDAEMINKAMKQLNLVENSILFIENVGNLVCPAMFDLGEQARVVIASVTEGDDKPLKYPDMFHTSNLCIINKTDLLPYVPFDIEKFKANARKVNHHLEFIELSALTNDGMQHWLHWLQHQLAHASQHIHE